jgi:hypothetical protein
MLSHLLVIASTAARSQIWTWSRIGDHSVDLGLEQRDTFLSVRLIFTIYSCKSQLNTPITGPKVTLRRRGGVKLQQSSLLHTPIMVLEGW